MSNNSFMNSLNLTLTNDLRSYVEPDNFKN
jgi:hypothetical protein